MVPNRLCFNRNRCLKLAQSSFLESRFLGEKLTSGQKFSVSLLISVVAFAVFSLLTLSGQFSFIEAKFYQPSVRHPIEQKINTLSEQEKQYTQILVDRFSSFAAEQSVLSYTQAKPSDQDVKQRSVVSAQLFSSAPYLLGIRIIDYSGKKIHFSTFAADKKKQDDKKVIYDDYNNICTSSNEPKFSYINCLHDKKYSIYNDPIKKRVIYSIPFFGKDDKGGIGESAVLLFYCEPSDFVRYLYSKNLITLGEKESAEFMVLDDGYSSGFIFGLPYRNLDLAKSGIESLKNAVLSKLENSAKNSLINEESIFLSGSYRLVDKKDSTSESVEDTKDDTVSTDGIASENSVLTSEYGWILFSNWVKLAPEQNYCFISFLYDDDIFSLGLGLRILLLILLFITVFLFVFLIFNMRHDDMVVIKDRIRRFQLAFISEYAGADGDKIKTLPDDIAARKESLSNEIRKSLGRRGKKHKEEVDKLLERTWQEILASFGGATSQVLPLQNVKAAIDSAELRSILEDILGSGTLKIQASSVTQNSSPKQIEPEPVEEAEELADAEPMEDAEELTDAEPVDDAEELTDAEPVEAAEELTDAEPVEDEEEVDNAESVEDAEELPDAEPVEDAEELTDAEPVDDEEELADAEPVEDAEGLADAEPVDDAEELTDAEPVEDAEELSDAEPVEDAEELTDAEPVEGAEELADAEPVEGAEELADAEPVEDAEELADAEPVEDAEELADAEPVEDAEELTDAEPVDDAEELTVAEPVEDAEELVDAEPVENAEELDAAELVEGAEELDAAELVEDAEELDAAEPVEDAEELTDAEPVEDAEELADAELVDDKEELADAEPVEDAEALTDAHPLLENDFASADAEFEHIVAPLTANSQGDYDEEMTFSSPPPFKHDEVVDETLIDSFNVAPVDFSFLDDDSITISEKYSVKVPDSDFLIVASDTTEETPTAEEDVESSTEQFVELEQPPENEILSVTPEQSPTEKAATDDSLEVELPLEEENPINTTLDSLDHAPEEENIVTTLEQPPEDEILSVSPEQTSTEKVSTLSTTELDEGLELLEDPKDTNPFSFTSFADNNNNIIDLESDNSDAIIENGDGTFRIEKLSDSSEVKLDSDFKKLVESVLQINGNL